MTYIRPQIEQRQSVEGLLGDLVTKVSDEAQD